jgi:hypothetical protein
MEEKGEKEEGKKREKEKQRKKVLERYMWLSEPAV